MFSSSDSEDETQIQQLLEAADPVFLSVFRNNFEIQKNTSTSKAKETKSQRYLEDVDKDAEADINIPSSMQDFMLKKMSELIQQKIEYEHNSTNPNCHEKQKSCIKLLIGAKHFIETNDQPESEPIIQRRPVIRRRKIDLDFEEKEAKKISRVTVCGKNIMEGKDVKFWAERKQRNIFCYKLGKDGILYEQQSKKKF